MIKKFVFLICLVLGIIPFLWFQPGELELGGDSNRLFLYDPASYLRSDSLFSVEPEGIGRVRPDQALLPFLLLLKGILFVVRSPYVLMSLLNSVKLVGAFYFLYRIVIELLVPYEKKSDTDINRFAGIVAGLFYAFSPSVGANMRAALLTHNQVFLNPLIFFLLLRFFVTSKNSYLWALLLVTFIFSPNFSLIAPPPPFAFYPLATLFLMLYTVQVLKKPLPWKKMIIGAVGFIGLHAFHIIPVAVHALDPSSYYNQRILDASTGSNEALNYFNAVRGLGKVSKNLFYTYADPSIRWSTFGAPVIIVLGFLLSKKIRKNLLLLSLFFFLTLFLLSANITDTGLAFYRLLFSIPGFGMFRVFYGQWQWVFAFFYSLLFGYTLYVVLAKLRLRRALVVALGLIGLFLYGSWQFISGDIFRGVHQGSNSMTSVVRFNPDYEKALAFIKNLPDDGKIINVPFTDYVYQVVPGTNAGAYIGVSPTAYLTGKRDFSGYPSLHPYAETFLRLMKEKDYQSLKRLFGLFNIRYIFYNSDPKAFTQYFPAFPYSLFQQAVRDDRELKNIVDQLSDRLVFESGDYRVYEIDSTYYLPHIYLPTQVNIYEKPSSDVIDGERLWFEEPPQVSAVAYMSRDVCSSVLDPETCTMTLAFGDKVPSITFERINPTKYRIEVTGARQPYILVFSDAFHKDWKLFQSSRSSVAQDRHFMVNGYANAWYISPEDLGNSVSYVLILEMTQQRLFYFGLAISVVSLSIFSLYGLVHIR